ncbi:MAG: sodium:solute symporter family protein [Leptospirales bacterium]
MQTLDIIVIALYFVVIIGVGVRYYSRSSKGMEEYFLSGRKLPWWIAGISMVATTFAADTPMAVTGLIAKYGIAGNWFWWGLAMSGFLTVFLYARLWRQAGVFTDAEFAEIRYSGRSAVFLRGFRAIYLAIPLNILIMGWVTLGMSKIIGVVYPDWSQEYIILVLYAITGLYLVVSGLWGVVIADFIQFFIAIFGSILLAVYTVQDFGGLAGLKSAYLDAGYPEQNLSVNPLSLDTITVTAFAWLFVQWWSSWYPGAEPGGGGYIAQRMLSAKSSKDATLSAFLFNILHYAVRPWPWIIVAIGAMVYFKGGTDPELGYPQMMVKLLPPGLFGLMSVSFLAAFMSTLSTQINWGASYLVSDVYKRFIKKDASDKQYVLASRIITFGLLALTYPVATNMTSIQGAWKIVFAIGAGTGPVYLLRWYWWRINAWSEISAMVAALIGVIIPVVLPFFVPVSVINETIPFLSLDNFGHHLLFTTAFTTVIWLSVTYATSPEKEEVLKSFCRRTRTGGPGWKHFSENPISFKKDLIYWIFSLVGTYGILTGLSQIFFGDTTTGWVITLTGIGILYYLFFKLFHDKNFDEDGKQV